MAHATLGGYVGETLIQIGADIFIGRFAAKVQTVARGPFD